MRLAAIVRGLPLDLNVVCHSYRDSEVVSAVVYEHAGHQAIAGGWSSSRCKVAMRTAELKCGRVNCEQYCQLDQTRRSWGSVGLVYRYKSPCVLYLLLCCYCATQHVDPTTQSQLLEGAAPHVASRCSRQRLVNRSLSDRSKWFVALQRCTTLRYLGKNVTTTTGQRWI